MGAGVSNQVYVNKTPWHGEGTKIAQGSTVVESIKSNPILSSKIDRCPTMFAHFDGELADDPQSFVHVRRADKRVVGRGGSQYVIADHLELAAFADDVAAALGATFEIAGTLRGGSQFVLQAKVGNQLAVRELRDGRTDTVDLYLTLGTSHDGLRPTEIGFATYRAECENMTAAAMQELRTGKRGLRYFALRHSGDTKGKLDDAAHAMRAGLKCWEQFAQFATKAAETAMPVSDFHEFALALLPNPAGVAARAEAKRAQLFDLFCNGQGNYGQTVWDAYNAVTEFTNYATTVRGAANDSERMQSRINSTLYGQGAQLAVEAEQALRVYVSLT